MNKVSHTLQKCKPKILLSFILTLDPDKHFSFYLESPYLYHALGWVTPTSQDTTQVLSLCKALLAPAAGPG